MLYIPDIEWSEYKRKIEALEDEVKEFRERFKYIKGVSPVIQASAGKRFDLNENLNVISVQNKLTNFEARITALETP